MAYLRTLFAGVKSAKEIKEEQSGKSISLPGSFKEKLTHLREKGYIAYTIPDKPKSSRQKYRLTELGERILQQYADEQE